jgi:hypothetical protein
VKVRYEAVVVHTAIAALTTELTAVSAAADLYLKVTVAAGQMLGAENARFSTTSAVSLNSFNKSSDSVLYTTSPSIIANPELAIQYETFLRP